MLCTQAYAEVSEELNAPIFNIEDILCKLAACSSRSICDYRWGLDWWMDLLTTYTSFGTISNYTAPPISTIHKSPQHPLSIFQHTVSSLAVPWQWLLTVDILQLHALRSSLHSLPYRTQLTSCPKPPGYNSQGGPHRKHSSSIVACGYGEGVSLQRPLFIVTA
jgi:hypothetical protein